MVKKPPSAKAVAAKAKREKAGMVENETVVDRVEAAHARAYPNDDAPVGDPSFKEEELFATKRFEFPSEGPIGMYSELDLMTAEEAKAAMKEAEAKYLGNPGPPGDTPSVGDLNDNVPSFLQTSAKEPPLDALGRTEKERKDRNLPVILAGKPENELPKRVTTILRDHDLEYPDLYMAVYVAGDWAVSDDEARFARLFTRSGCYRADSVDQADLVVFGGGSDVEPLLYGESNANAHPSVYFNTERDASDMDIYLKARANGTPMMGVCRGAQFLHVMNGGKLYQDIDNHNGPHKAFALREKLLIESVSSVHHQSCRYNKEGGMEVLLTTANGAKNRWINNDEKDKRPSIDIEAFFYRDTGCFGVQGHPEYANYNKFSVWCLEQINSLFLTSPDFVWEGKRLQMTKAARDAINLSPSGTKTMVETYLENQFNASKEV